MGRRNDQEVRAVHALVLVRFRNSDGTTTVTETVDISTDSSDQEAVGEAIAAATAKVRARFEVRP